MEVFIDRAFDYGLPTALLCLLLFGLWRAVCWLGPNFLTPIKDQIVIHLEKLDLSIDSLMALIQGQTEAIAKQNEVLDRVENRINEAGVDADSSNEILRRIDANVTGLQRDASRFFSESHTEHVQTTNDRETKSTASGD